MQLYKDLKAWSHPLHRALETSLRDMITEVNSKENRTLSNTERDELKALRTEEIKTQFADASKNRVSIIDKKLQEMEEGYTRRQSLHYDKSAYQLSRWQSQLRMASDAELSSIYESYVDSPQTGQVGDKVKPPAYMETVLAEMRSRNHEDTELLRNEMKAADYLNIEWKSTDAAKVLLTEKAMLSQNWGVVGVALEGGQQIETERIDTFITELEEEENESVPSA